MNIENAMNRSLWFLGIIAGVLALGGCDSGSGTIALQIVPPYTTPLFTTFQNASIAIGQPNLTTGTSPSTPSATNLSVQYGNIAVKGSVLYVPDYSDHRVLGFNSIPTTNGASANFVLGQTSFTTNAPGISATQFNGPQTVQEHNGMLLLDDYSNSRILIFSTAPTTTNAAANVAVGQASLAATAPPNPCTQSNLNMPESFFAVNGKLIVGDSHSNRVMIWNSIPTTSGAPANLVLGQNSFTTCIGNDDLQTGAGGAPSARTLQYPTGIWSDGTRLIVQDSANHRILIWNTFPTANFTPANVVIGQGDFTHIAANDDNQDGTTDAAPSARTLNNPYYIDSDGIALFVTDNFNNRVLIWNHIPTTNFTPPDIVLGQASFTAMTANDDNQDGVQDAGPSGRTLSGPRGLKLVGKQLFVTDGSNYRQLIFQGQ